MKKMSPRRGRPLSFDREDVLDKAVLVFWNNGYDGASIDDLTKAMGINPPSLYSTFGSKRGLFIAAIDRYASTHGSRAFGAFRLEPDTRKAVANFFNTSIKCATQKGKPHGCLIASDATVEAQKDTELRDKLAGMFTRTDQAIARRIRDAQQNGLAQGDQDPEALAGMVTSVVHSIVIRARSGASRKELSKITDDFMAVFFPPPHRQRLV